MMGRRAVALLLTLTLGLLATPFAADAQQAGKARRIGWLRYASRSEAARYLEVFRQALRERGYVEGRSLVIEQRYSGGRPEHLLVLAEDLASLNVDLIVSSGSAATSAAKRVAATVPVVFVTEDPLEDNPVASGARPGGNVTGMALMNPEIGAQWVELVRDALPAIRRVAILWDPTGTRVQLRSAEAAARSLGLATLTIIGHQPHEIHAAFEAAMKERVDAVVILSSATLASQKQDRQGPWPDDPPVRPLPGGRGYPVDGGLSGALRLPPEPPREAWRAQSPSSEPTTTRPAGGDGRGRGVGPHADGGRWYSPSSSRVSRCASRTSPQASRMVR